MYRAPYGPVGWNVLWTPVSLATSWHRATQKEEGKWRIRRREEQRELLAAVPHPLTIGPHSFNSSFQMKDGCMILAKISTLKKQVTLKCGFGQQSSCSSVRYQVAGKEGKINFPIQLANTMLGSVQKNRQAGNSIMKFYHFQAILGLQLRYPVSF